MCVGAPEVKGVFPVLVLESTFDRIQMAERKWPVFRSMKYSFVEIVMPPFDRRT